MSSYSYCIIYVKTDVVGIRWRYIKHTLVPKFTTNSISFFEICIGLHILEKQIYSWIYINLLKIFSLLSQKRKQRFFALFACDFMKMFITWFSVNAVNSRLV